MPAAAATGVALRPLYVAAFVAYADRFAIAPLLVAISRTCTSRSRP